MPIYEYECNQCGSVEEVLQKVSDKPLTRCNRCSGRLNKLVSHTSFHLKGTGWYATDYAGKSRTSAPKESPDGSNDKKAESPPDAGTTATNTQSKSSDD
ncbi:MAG: FmdB family zinc ribbon protein [Deltaproteobacteria bacterium]|nr:FmdB family zinc ribbon protein [Deltaproteobacteria bacterium]